MAEGLPTNPIEIFRVFNEYAVDFVVIGGLAVQTHGHPRTTRDVDLVIGLDPANLERAAGALAELKAGLRGVDADLLGIDVTDPEVLRTGGNFTMHTTAGDLDVFTDTVPGAAPFHELRERALEVDIFGFTIAVASLDDLISMKRAAGRPRDLNDIAVLTRELGDSR